MLAAPPGDDTPDGAEGRELVPEPAEQAALALIRQLRTAGQSVRSIAATLTAEGHQPKRGGQWHPETVRHILARGPARQAVVTL